MSADHDRMLRIQTDIERIRRQARRTVDREERGDTPPPSSTTLSDLLTEPDDEPDWRIEHLWPSAATVLLAAARKTGKTTLVSNLVRCLADGDRLFAGIVPWGESFAVRALDDGEAVHVIDLEMPRRLLRDLLAEQGIEHTERVRVSTLRGMVGHFDVLDDEHRERWAKYLSDLDTRVLIVDPLAPLLARMGVDESSNTEVGRVLGALDELRAMAGVSELLVCHHAGHGAERSRGASRLRDWPDVEWRMMREQTAAGREPPPDAARYFAAEGRADVGLRESRVRLDVGHRLVMVGGTREQDRALRDADAVMDAARLHPGGSENAIAGELLGSGVGTTTIRRTLQALVDDGRIHRQTGANRAKLHHAADVCPGSPECAGRT